MKKKWIAIGLLTLILALFLTSPLAAYAKSLAVMKIYSFTNERESLLAEKGIGIELGTDEGWYPFVMTFNADEGFRAFTGDKDIRLTILYNFPEFDVKRGCSRIYDDTCEYYNSFYGAYAVNERYGIDEKGNVDLDKISRVPRYDFTRLVLGDLGMPKKDEVFSWEVDGVTKGVSLAGYDDWVCLDAEMTVNGVLHERCEKLRNYIQYGSPNYDTEENFAPVQMRGRIYARYFEEAECSIFFYVMARSDDVLESCDENILAAADLEVFENEQV